MLGLRSGSEEEFNFAKKSGITYFTARQIKGNLQSVKSKLKRFVGKADVYVNVDIDAFDPSYAPAVDQPEPGGISFFDFQELVAAIDGRLVGTDLVCFRPIEGNEVTEFLAVRVIYEVLGLVKK
jgi:agmatinase